MKAINSLLLAELNVLLVLTIVVAVICHDIPQWWVPSVVLTGVLLGAWGALAGVEYRLNRRAQRSDRKALNRGQ